MTKLFVPEYPPVSSTDEMREFSEYTYRQLSSIQDEIDSQADSGGSFMVWRGYWQEGKYYQNNVTVDNGWLAVANKETTDPPAPRPVGEVRNIINIPGAPTFATNNVTSGSLVIGTRYLLQERVYIRDARFFVPTSAAGLRADAWLVLDPDTDPSFSVLVSGQIIDATDTNKWISLPVGITFVQDQRTFDVIAAFTPVSGSTSFQGVWIYNRKNADPQAGEMNHMGGSDKDTIKVHKMDNALTDRSAELNNISGGSDIEMLGNGYVWRVLNASVSGDIYTFNVQPDRRAPEATSNFEFSYYNTTTINYVETLNHYTSVAGVNGFISTTGYAPAINPVTLTQNAYGIDIQIQEVYTSNDWEFLAYSG